MSMLLKTINLNLIKNNFKTIIFIWSTVIIDQVSALLLLLFLFTGSFTVIKISLSQSWAIPFDIFLSIMFFLQHSIFVRPGFRKWLGKYINDLYHNAFYGLTSGIVLLSVMILWQKSDIIIFKTDGIAYWLIRSLFFIPLIGFIWGSIALGSFDVTGIKPLILSITRREEKTQKIVIRGPYLWVRHPLYLFSIILIWLVPVVTLDRFVFNIIWTVWIVLATRLEDKDLHKRFGAQYSQYSSQVPMLIPYKIKRLNY